MIITDTLQLAADGDSTQLLCNPEDLMKTDVAVETLRKCYANEEKVGISKWF